MNLSRQEGPLFRRSAEMDCPVVRLGGEVKEPTEHITMAELLALLLERLPEWPPIKNDESKIRAALHVLMPEPKWRHECREDIEAALTLIEKNEFFRRRRKQDTRAIAPLLAALKRAQTAKARLPLLQAGQFESVCNLQAGVAFCERQQGEQELPRRTHLCSHRLFDAVQTAYHLVQLWLVVRRGICDADNLNQQSPWYKLSAILLGKDVNLLSHMLRYRGAIARAHAAVADAEDRRRERHKLFQMVPVRGAGLD
jgi:hypothetical protein